MTTYEAISEVSTSLKKLVWNNLKETNLGKEVGENDITLDHPTENHVQRKLSMFLFRIGENSFHRNHPPPIDGNDQIYPPITLDLFYMITSHFDTSLKDHTLMDQKLIGRIIQIFNENPVLHVPSLVDTLSGEKIKILSHDMPIEEISKIWGGIIENNPYKLSVFYEVTPVRIDSENKSAIKRTTEIKAEAKDKGEHDD